MASQAENKADRFAERGITIRIAQKEDNSRIWQLVVEHFFPLEPVCRCMGMSKNDTLFSKLSRRIFRESVVTECLKQQLSLIAVDRDGEIVGVKTCRSVKSTDKRVNMSSLMWLDPLLWMLPAQWSRLVAVQGMMTKIKYDPWVIMEEMNINKIFVGELLCVSSKARGLGLGSELVRRALKLASEDDCQGYLVALSGIYSQKIYHDLGFQVLYRAEYSEERDKFGTLVVPDPREHTHTQTSYKSL